MLRRRERWWVRELERSQREHAAERQQLIATICRLAGHPEPRQEREPVAEFSLPLVMSPEQLPENEWDEQ